MKYKKVITLTIITLFALFLGLLVVYSETDTTRITNFKLASVSDIGVNTHFQTLSWEISRPIATNPSQDLTELINFEPEIEGRFRNLGDRILFTPTSPLLYDQNYKVSFSKNMRDIYGKQLSQSYEFEFTTKKQYYTYEKPVPDTSQVDLYLANMNQEKSEIIKNTRIRSVASDPTSDQIYFVNESESATPSILQVYDISDDSLKEITLPEELIVDNLQVSREGRVWFKASVLGRIDPKLYVYNPQTDEFIVQEQLEQYFPDLNQFIIAPDGFTILIHTFGYDTILAEIATGEGISLGEFNSLANFSYNSDFITGTVIQFAQENFNPAVKIVGQEGEVFSTESDVYARDPYLGNSGELVLFTEKVEDLDFAEGMFKLSSNKDKSLARENQSIGLPKLSGDNKYIAVELTEKDILENLQREIRQMRNAGRPDETDLVFYSLSDFGEELFSIDDANNLYWIK